MTDAVATGDVPRAVTGDARKAGNLLLHRRRSSLLCAWVLRADLPPARQHALLADRGHRLPEAGFPSFDFGSVQFFLDFAGVARALWNSVARRRR